MRKMITTAVCFTAMTAIASAGPVQDTGFHRYSQRVPGSSYKHEMVPIPAGTVTLSDGSGNKKTVKISPFWIGAHEVTYDAFDVFFKDEDVSQNSEVDAVTRPSPQYVDLSWGMGKQDGFPVNSMSQTAALMYCRWLYEKTGVFYRLPTEAEWEYACRAGSKSRFFFGDDPAKLKEYAWFSENSDNAYHKVGSKKPNAWGLYDMLGNVAEWTLDQYVPDYVAQLPSTTDPVMPHKSRYPKVLRGGHYQSKAADMGSSNRLASEPSWNKRDPQLPKSIWWLTDAPFAGFRLVRPLKQPSAEEIEKFFKTYLTR